MSRKCGDAIFSGAQKMDMQNSSHALLFICVIKYLLLFFYSYYFHHLLSSNNLSMLHQKYIPIRVDVTLEDESKLRIVDTLLLDRTVLPLPLEPHRLEESLSGNALYMAKSILGDAEVIGMGRTVRHFTGRMDLWSWEMVEKIQKCIFEQLYAAFHEADVSEPSTKKVKTSHTTESLDQQKAKEEGKDDTETINASKLIPIRIRMELNGHRIHDDFDWDPSLDMDPLIMTKSIGSDLNLPPEAVQELAINITEQILGLAVEDGGSREDAAIPIGPATTTAWTLEPKVQQSNLAHLAIVTNTTKDG